MCSDHDPVCKHFAKLDAIVPVVHPPRNDWSAIIGKQRSIGQKGSSRAFCENPLSSGYGPTFHDDRLEPDVLKGPFPTTNS